MSNRRKPTSALFPVKTEFPESRKMSENFDGNAAIYDFFDYLLSHGYVLARRDPESGELRAMKVRPTVEHEVLMFRGVDKLAYAMERDAMRAAYPHLWARYGLSDEAPIYDGVPEYAEPPGGSRGRPPALPDRRGDSVPDDLELSMAEAFRRGVMRGASYTGIRMKMMRSRRLYPEITPKMRPRGAETLYRVGDLRKWQDEYDQRSANNYQQSAWARDNKPDEPVLEQPVTEAVDALAFLMSKIRGGEEDVRQEED